MPINTIMVKKFKSINVSEETYAKLLQKGSMADTFDSLISKLLEEDNESDKF